MRHFATAVVGAFVLMGCSAKEENLPEVAVPAESKKIPNDPLIGAALDDVNSKVKAQQYDAAVANLITISSMPKSGAQHDAYMNQVRQVEAALSKRISEGDQKAMETKRMMDAVMYRR